MLIIIVQMSLLYYCIVSALYPKCRCISGIVNFIWPAQIL
uniref:Uncharacterized protein n=1 Tax=Anguilla anguilla TaxID=7936 RepID=A0A0E9XUH6_ANGAN